MEELGVPQRTFYDWTSQKRSLMQKQVNKAIAMDLLNPYLTQQEVAERNGCSQAAVSRYQKELLCKIAELAKMNNEEFGCLRERIGDVR